MRDQIKKLMENLPVPSSVWIDASFSTVYAIASKMHTEEFRYVVGRAEDGGTRVKKLVTKVVYKLDDPPVLSYSGSWGHARRALADAPLGSSFEISEDELKKYRNAANQIRMYEGKKFTFRRQENGRYKIYYTLQDTSIKGARTTLTEKIVRLEIGESCFGGNGRCDRLGTTRMKVVYWEKKLGRKFEIVKIGYKTKITRVS